MVMKVYSLRRLRVAGWSLKAAARVAGILGRLSRNKISIGEVLSRVSSSDGMLNADMFCDSTCIFRWFGVVLKGPVLRTACGPETGLDWTEMDRTFGPSPCF